MRLFSALVPPPEARESLRAFLAGEERRTGLRWGSEADWHLTLGFYGDGGDPVERLAWLAERLRGRDAPIVRVAGSGTFPGVLWAGVHGEGLAGLAEAAGADLELRDYRPHLTLARWPRDRTSAAAETVAARLHEYAGPWWPAGEVVLMRSYHGETDGCYTAVGRVALSRRV